ncbi:MAG: hypothetical protein JJV92_03005 [Desulfosarcina sp.]|nr:hypothetical protein [Desulfobacterales bacterium]
MNRKVQIRALSQAISIDRARYFLAKEVGLGKTIEAGLIMRELKLRARNGYDEVKPWFVKIGSKAKVKVSHA